MADESIPTRIAPSARRVPIALALGFLRQAGFGERLEAQVADVVIRDCSGDCALEIEELVTLGDTTGATDGFVGRPAALLRRPDGSFLLADRLDPGALKLFSAEGTFVRRVGRRGEGPGEYQIVQFLLPLPGDSIEVLDLAQQRSTVLAPDLTVARTTASVPVAAETLALDSARHRPSHEHSGAGGMAAPPGLAGGGDREVLRCRAQDDGDPELRPLLPAAGPGLVEPILGAHLTAYMLERYDESGTLISRLRREVGWFPPHDDFGSVGPDDPPSPGLRALHVDDDGHVRVVISVPDPEWRNALTPTVDRFGQDSYEYRRSSVYDTVVEIIDPERSVVVGRSTLDAAVLGFTPGGLMYALEEAGNLEPYVRVWRVSGLE